MRTLIAVELDATSETVLEYGLTMGLLLQATVSVLHVSKPEIQHIRELQKNILEIESEAADRVENFTEHPTDEEALEALNHMISRVCDSLNLSEAPRAKVHSDFTVAGIINEVRNADTDILVIGSHVDVKSKQMKTSSLARELIKRLNKSVIIVPSHYGYRNLDHIAVFTTLTLGDVHMLYEMVDLALADDLQLTIVYQDKAENSANANYYFKIFKQILADHAQDLPTIRYLTFNQSFSTITDELFTAYGVDLIVTNSTLRSNFWQRLQDPDFTSPFKNMRLPLYIWKAPP